MMENNFQGFKELPSGTVLNAGKYIIEKKIGEGGFGITYKAVQAGLNRPVCIKEYFLSGRCVRNTQARTLHLQGISAEKYEKFRRAFVKEAQTVASLHHPNIVEVIDIFDENNTSYMVMSFIEGRSLQDIVNANGPLSYPEAVNYMAQITNAVGYIHEHNILHRDIKPENIMITADYKAILIDFGSAREFEQDKTQMHTTMLTHGYAPPEQYTANSRKGAYTDIYALGATLYYILTAKVPMEAAARLTEELVEPKRWNPSIPPEGNRTVMKAMRLKPEERYQSAQDFMNDMRNTNPQADSSNGKLKMEIKEQSPKKNLLWIWIVAALVVVLGGVIVRNVVHERNVKQEDCAEKEARYVEFIEKFDLHLRLISENADSEDPARLVDPTHMMEALTSLRGIEDFEMTDCFKNSGKTECYQNRLDYLIPKIEKENDDIAYVIENNRESEEDSQLQELLPKLEKRYSMNGTILRVLDETGSVIAVFDTIDKMRERK